MIIKSLLDTDFYKYTMGQVALHQFPEAQVRYEFKCRNVANWTNAHVSRIIEEVSSFCDLKLNCDEIDYLKSLGIFKDSYLDFLKVYKPDYNNFDISLKNGELKISVEGSWFTAIYWEVPLLAIVNEVYFENDYEAINSGVERLAKKTEVSNALENPFKFADFGTRRRFSADWHSDVVEHLKDNCNNFIGTSNVMLAMNNGLKPIGTMAHEFLQIGQAVAPLIDSQRFMLESWLKEYRGKLGIALTDIVGFDAFLRDFDHYLANAYSGLRHDSGNPYVWATKALAHYYKLGIDTKTKTLVFSDGLNFDIANRIHRAYSNVINIQFGIGTHITNDFENITPLQIVMKIVECNGQPVAKISDSVGKGMCNDPEYVSHLRKVFKIK